MGFNIKNKFLFDWATASFAISTILYILSLWFFKYGVLFKGLVLYIPALVVVLIRFIGTKTKVKFPKATKIVSTILNIFIVIFFQLFIYGLATLLLISSILEMDVTNIKNYNRALSNITHKERIIHFPRQIPENVSDIKLYESHGGIFGSEEIYLTFIADKAYINNELSKYKFEKIEGPFENTWDYDYPLSALGPNNFKIGGFKHYMIKKNNTRRLFSYGILIKEKTNQIMFYYATPD